MAGILAAARPPTYEVFPFFCWFLFPIAPNVEERYALRVAELGGARVVPPTWLEELDVLDDPWAMDAHWTIQALGRAVEAGRSDDVRTLRRRLEAHFLPTPARYELVRIRFEVLERWREGRLRQTIPVARFRSAGATSFSSSSSSSSSSTTSSATTGTGGS